MSVRTKRIVFKGGLYSFFLFLSIGSIYIVWLQGPTYFSGDDLTFHLSRIEGLAQSIQRGEFLPRINYFLAEGMGYPTGIFYPEIFLYPAALFRVMGFSIVSSYQFYLLLLNFGTFVLAYHCFNLIHQTKSGSVLFSILYGLSAYRMSDVLYRGAVGESVAFLLFPLIYVGIYQILYGKRQYWWLLTLGMTGLFYSHTLSAFIAVLFLVIYCLSSFRSLFKNKQRLFFLFLATFMTFFLSIDVLLPMIEQLLFQRLRVQEVSLFYLQKEASTIGEYLCIAMRNIGFNNLGLLVPIGLIFGWLYWRREKKEEKKLLVIASIFFLCSTSYFPHSYFHHTLFNSIQFPWRYFLVVTFLISWLLASYLSEANRMKLVYKVILGLFFIVGTVGLSVQNQVLLKQVSSRQYSAHTYNQLDGKTSLGYGKEFLPSNMNGWVPATGLLSEPQEQVEITKMARNGNAFYLHYNTKEETRLIYPLLYYKGYIAEINGHEQAIEDAGTFQGESMHGFVQVTVKGEGDVLIWYKGTLIQHVSRVIGFCSWLVFIGYIFLPWREWKGKIRILARKKEADQDL